jgi:flagella basal body P-ring formation protein FlgA
MSDRTLRLLLFAGLALAGGARADGNAVMVLRAAADLPGTRYTLGDIADIETTDGALQRRLAAIPIGAVPRQGYAESVSRAQLETLVRKEVSPALLEWRGAAEVRIRGHGQHVEAETLSDAAADALYAVLSREFDAITMQPVGGFDGVNVPAGTMRLSARVPEPQRVAKRMSALVDVSIDGQFYTTVPVWFAVHASRPALLARVALHAGDALRAEDFQTQTIDLTGNAPQALPGNAPLEGMRLRRSLEPGMALAAAHVEPRPSVARDQQVAVRVTQGAVTIETMGRAVADARVGEMTTIRNTSTNETYSARVVADGVVMVRGE